MTPPVQGRLYDTLLTAHLASERQIALVAGPRQVGKTTTCRHLADEYLNWDNPDHRRLILEGPRAVADRVGLDRLGERRPVVLFDELHKYARWKSFLKGCFDTYEDRIRIIVTGSARLDVFRRGGDSRGARDETLSDALDRMQAQTQARHAFQCVIDSPSSPRTAFARRARSSFPRARCSVNCCDR